MITQQVLRERRESIQDSSLLNGALALVGVLPTAAVKQYKKEQEEKLNPEWRKRRYRRLNQLGGFSFLTMLAITVALIIGGFLYHGGVLRLDPDFATWLGLAGVSAFCVIGLVLAFVIGPMAEKYRPYVWRTRTINGLTVDFFPARVKQTIGKIWSVEPKARLELEYICDDPLVAVLDEEDRRHYVDAFGEREEFMNSLL